MYCVGIFYAFGQTFICVCNCKHKLFLFFFCSTHDTIGIQLDNVKWFWARGEINLCWTLGAFNWMVELTCFFYYFIGCNFHTAAVLSCHPKKFEFSIKINKMLCALECDMMGWHVFLCLLHISHLTTNFFFITWNIQIIHFYMWLLMMVVGLHLGLHCWWLQLDNWYLWNTVFFYQ